MDLDRVMKNPASAFETPEAVSQSTQLTAEQKRAVLLQWKDHLQQLQTADEEGMQRSEGGAGTTGDILRRVTNLLSDLESKLKGA